MLCVPAAAALVVIDTAVLLGIGLGGKTDCEVGNRRSAQLKTVPSDIRPAFIVTGHSRRRRITSTTKPAQPRSANHTERFSMFSRVEHPTQTLSPDAFVRSVPTFFRAPRDSAQPVLTHLYPTVRRHIYDHLPAYAECTPSAGKATCTHHRTRAMNSLDTMTKPRQQHIVQGIRTFV